MSGLEVVRPARSLEEQPLDDAEIALLADGYPPVTISGMPDHEEVVIHLARRLLDAEEELADVIAERDQARQELRDEIGG